MHRIIVITQSSFVGFNRPVRQAREKAELLGGTFHKGTDTRTKAGGT